MMRERELLRGSFWVVPLGGGVELDMNFLSEFFTIEVQEYFDEKREEFRRLIILRKKKKFLNRDLTN